MGVEVVLTELVVTFNENKPITTVYDYEKLRFCLLVKSKRRFVGTQSRDNIRTTSTLSKN